MCILFPNFLSAFLSFTSRMFHLFHRDPKSCAGLAPPGMVIIPEGELLLPFPALGAGLTNSPMSVKVLSVWKQVFIKNQRCPLQPGQLGGGPARSHILHHSSFPCAQWEGSKSLHSWSDWFGAEVRAHPSFSGNSPPGGFPTPPLLQDGVASWTFGTFWISLSQEEHYSLCF